MAVNYERDRFVAFAFAAADAFLEVDFRGKIKFAAGALDWLAGKSGQDLIGHNLEGYCSGRSRKILRAAAESARTRGRFGPITLLFQGVEGRDRLISVYGTCLPEYPDSAFLSLKATSHPSLNTVGTNVLDEETIILNADAFKALAAGLMAQIKSGEEGLALTLLEVRELEETVGRLEPDAAEELLERIAAHLCAASLGGSSAGRLSGKSFGFIHAVELDVAAALKEIQNFENGDGLKIKAATITLDDAGLSEVDRVRSLVYAIDTFWNNPEEFAIGDLGESYKSLLDHTRTRLARFKRVVAGRQFDIVAQPVVGLKSKKVHHYEALARFEAKDVATLPREFITDAEDLGVICDFDIAMCRRVVERIEKAHAAGKALAMSVNVSIQSLATDRFVTELIELLQRCGEYRECVIFEIAEATKIKDIEATGRVLSKISRLGHPVCLDDFGTEEQGYHCLRALNVDFVKIDGAYVRKAFSNSNARALFRSMVQLCQDIDIRTVGEAVETASEAKFLRDIGVDYAQGYFFGKPAMGISDHPGPYIF